MLPSGLNGSRSSLASELQHLQLLPLHSDTVLYPVVVQDTEPISAAVTVGDPTSSVSVYPNYFGWGYFV